jgi:hypothetical protein
MFGAAKLVEWVAVLHEVHFNSFQVFPMRFSGDHKFVNDFVPGTDEPNNARRIARMCISPRLAPQD